MSDNYKAPVWFLENVLKNRLNQLAEPQSQDIRNFNQTVARMVSKQLGHSQKSNRTVCGGCNISFDGRSVPEQCSQCSMFFHKYKCFPSNAHACYARRRSASCGGVIANNPEQISAHTPVAPTPVYTAQPDFTPIASATPTRAPSPDQGPLSGQQQEALPIVSQPQPCGSGVSRVPAPPHHTPDLQPSGQDNSGMTAAVVGPSSFLPLDPNAAPFVSYTASLDTAPSNNVGNKQKKNSKVKAKNSSTNNQDGLALEYAKYEVSVTQTKLRDLENTNKDLTFKNGLLEKRVADLEIKQKQDIYDRYFPKQGSQNKHCESVNQKAQENQHHPPSQSSSPHTCQPHLSTSCHPPPTYCSYLLQHCQGCRSSAPTPTPGNAASMSQEIMEKLDIIKSDINGVKCKMEVFSEVTIPRIVRDTLSASSDHHPTLSSQTSTDPDPPHEPQTNHSNTNDINIDQEINEVSHHTIDDDIHDVSEDLN